MKTIALCSFLFFLGALAAQHNCKSFIEKGTQVNSCHHLNGSVSTREEWDKEKRNGRLKIYTKDGIQLHDFHLRSYAGHASVRLYYHKNGQVSQAEYSEAPDGGIQFFRAKYQYDENGRQTDKWEEEYPFKPFTEPVMHQPPQPLKKAPAQTPTTTAQCASPCFSVFEIRNLSRKKISVFVKARPNLYTAGKSKNLQLKPGETFRVDSLVYAERHIEPAQVYEFILSEKDEKKHAIVQIIPVPTGATRYYTFLIIPEANPSITE